MPEGTILAHVGRTLTLAHALSSLQVEIRFAASGEHAERISRSGWPVAPVHTRSRKELFDQMARKGNAFTREQLEEYVEDERRVLGEIRPDIVIGDFRPSLCISAVSMRIPYVSVVNAVWTSHCAVRFAPPLTMPLTKIFGQTLLEIVQPYLEGSLYRYFARPFNVVRRKYGLPGFSDIRDAMCSEDLTLMPDVPEFLPLDEATKPKHYRYVGPIFWEPDVEMPEWIDALDRNRPIVYITMGSTGPLDQIRTLARILAARGLQVVCTTATHTPGDIPEGVFTAPYAPGAEMCAIADVVVCHGGNGTIYQALSQGRPIVGVATFHDQEFNMQRVEALGLGKGVCGMPSDLASRVDQAVHAPAGQELPGQGDGVPAADAGVGCGV